VWHLHSTVSSSDNGESNVSITKGDWTKERCDGWLINGVIYIPNVYQEYDDDANLIIAAPLLLAACEAACSVIPDRNPIKAQIIAAIRKAKP
jgi:hypothetical protein